MQWSKIFFEEKSKKKYEIESDAMHTTYSYNNMCQYAISTEIYF